MVFGSKKSSAGVYFVILLFLLAFFMLWPMLKTGHQGLFLWLVWILMLIFCFIKLIVSQKNVYLLTNRRVIHLQAISKNEYKLLGFIKISDIDRVYKQRKNICIISKKKKYFLNSIDSVDTFYQKLNSYIKD